MRSMSEFYNTTTHPAIASLPPQKTPMSDNESLIKVSYHPIILLYSEVKMCHYCNFNMWLVSIQKHRLYLHYITPVSVMKLFSYHCVCQELSSRYRVPKLIKYAVTHPC